MSALSDAAFAMFALQQPITIGDLAAPSRERRLPMADPQTPDWFAAMATGGSSLLDIAPELRVLPVEPEPASVADVQGLDLVRIYSDQIAELEVEDAGPPQSARDAATTRAPLPEAARQMGLLKELEGLDE